VTKRWERELRRLDDVDAPTERIRAHAAGRPTDPSHGDGLPPRRQRITAGVVAVVVFVAAGTFAWQAFRPSDDPTTIGTVDTDGALVVTLHAPTETQGDIAFPTATFTLGGHSTDIATQGVDGWPDIPDDVGFDDPLYSLGFDVPAGTELVVEGDASSASATVRDDMAIDTATFVDLDLSDGTGTLPTDVGQHVIDLTGTWPDGTATFTAAFRIVPVAPVDGTEAVLSFVGKNAPEGTLAFGGRDQSGTQSEYTWCDGSGGCVNGISDFATYPPVSKFIEIPAGTSLTLDGTLPSIKGVFRTLRGERASPTIDDPSDLGTVPTEPGRYALELHVALDGENNEHGSATFWFGVEMVPTAPPTASPVPSANASPSDVSDVLRISCGGGGTQVLTPVVAAGPDGVDVELLDADISGAVARPTGLLRVEWYLQEGVSPVQLPVGEVDLQCGEGTSYRSADFVPEATATIVDPGGTFVPFALDCPIDEQSRLRVPAIAPIGDRSDAPSAVEAVTKRLEGIVSTDVVETAGYPEGDWPWPWVRIVRDGRIVAWAGVDGREEWRYRLNRATSCADTGIGTPESNQDSFSGFG
jgi:hypothetical protein